MALSREEQEVIITKTADKDIYDVYCTDLKYMKKLDKISNAYKEDIINGEVVAKYYKLTIKQLLLRNEPKKRELTEEQREVLRERLNNARNSQ